MSICVGLSDKDAWFTLNYMELKPIGPDVKPVLDPAGVGPPAPVLGPAARPDVGVEPVLEPRGPNIPNLAKPPTKVGVGFLSYFLYLFCHKTCFDSIL